MSSDELIRIRVTELTEWWECRQRWSYKYLDEIQPKQDEELHNAPLISGSAIHFGFEAGLLASLGHHAEAAKKAAALYLDSRLGEAGERFLKGVYTALDGVPSWLWHVSVPQSETELIGEYPDEGFYLIGRPDLWHYSCNGIDIWDLKSTSSGEKEKLERYTTWAPQIRFYAVLLEDWLKAQGLEVPPVYVAYAVVSTRGNHAMGTPRLLTERQKVMTRRTLRLTAQDIVAAHASPGDYVHMQPSNQCGWCDFAPICEGDLTGARIRDIVEEKYEKRRHRG